MLLATYHVLYYYWVIPSWCQIWPGLITGTLRSTGTLYKGAKFFCDILNNRAEHGMWKGLHMYQAAWFLHRTVLCIPTYLLLYVPTYL
jgi:hypothetical protein